MFTSILALVLLANLTRARLKGLGPGWVSVLLSRGGDRRLPGADPGSAGHRVLADPGGRRGSDSLGPVFFAGLLFATLIENEHSFYQAYASNVLGAMVGGACEYLSLVVGFRLLVLVTLEFYVATVLTLRKALRLGVAP